jgi:hypothetical protein
VARPYRRAAWTKEPGESIVFNRARASTVVLDTLCWLPGDVAEWLRSGLQSRLHRFDSGRRLCENSLQIGMFSSRGA